MEQEGVAKRVSRQYIVSPESYIGTMGWISRAIDRGLRVVHRPMRFGDTQFVVKDSAANVVILRQNTQNGRKLDVSGFSACQQSIVEILCGCGLVVCSR